MAALSLSDTTLIVGERDLAEASREFCDSCGVSPDKAECTEADEGGATDVLETTLSVGCFPDAFPRPRFSRTGGPRDKKSSMQHKPLRQEQGLALHASRCKGASLHS